MRRYFRDYPWGVQVIFFLGFTLSIYGGASAIFPGVLPRITGYSFAQLVEGITPNTPLQQVHVSLIVQGIFNLFMFFLPAFLFAYLTHPNPSGYLGLRLPGRKIHWLLCSLVILGAIPVLDFIGGLTGLIDFGKDVKASQQEYENQANAFLNMPDFPSFIRVLAVMAIVPAIGEEMFFRGIMMRFARKKALSMLLPVVFSAAIFAAAHGNIYGLPAIFLAGVLLAVVYNLTGSLWCSILMHFIFNGLQIVLKYCSNFNPGLKSAMDSDMAWVITVISGALLFCVSFYLLWKTKTPLPGNWADDFTPEEQRAGLDPLNRQSK